MKRYIHNNEDLYPIEVIPEGNDENDNPTCWGITITDSKGKNHFIWISLYDEGYQVEDSNGNNLAKGLIYKTFSGAKKKAFEIARRQEARELFSD